MFYKARFNDPKPFCVHEVIADGPIQTPEYYSVGKVTEFNGCYFLECIRGGDLNCLKNFGKIAISHPQSMQYKILLYFLFPSNW